MSRQLCLIVLMFETWPGKRLLKSHKGFFSVFNQNRDLKDSGLCLRLCLEFCNKEAILAMVTIGYQVLATFYLTDTPLYDSNLRFYKQMNFA